MIWTQNEIISLRLNFTRFLHVYIGKGKYKNIEGKKRVGQTELTDFKKLIFKKHFTLEIIEGIALVNVNYLTLGPTCLIQ